MFRGIPPPTPASPCTSCGLGGGKDLGVLSLRAASVRELLLLLPLAWLDTLCAVGGLLNREPDDPDALTVLE